MGTPGSQYGTSFPLVDEETNDEDDEDEDEDEDEEGSGIALSILLFDIVFLSLSLFKDDKEEAVSHRKTSTSAVAEAMIGKHLRSYLFSRAKQRRCLWADFKVPCSAQRNFIIKLKTEFLYHTLYRETTHEYLLPVVLHVRQRSHRRRV